MNRVLLALLPVSAIATAVLFAQAPTKSTKAAPKAATKAPAAKAFGDLTNPATLNATAPATYRVKFATTKGEVLIDVTRAWAPLGADRFYNLVRGGYYTDCSFYRVISNFMAQFGISARAELNPIWDKASIRDDTRKESNKRGTISFATSGPNSRSTTMFINLVDNAYLDPLGFAPIGSVVQGMNIVDSLYNLYGDLSVQQFAIEKGGKAFVDRVYPKLDRILTATVVPALTTPVPVPPAPKQ